MNIKIPYTDTRITNWREAFTLLFAVVMALVVFGPPCLFACWFLFGLVGVQEMDDDHLGTLAMIMGVFVCFALAIGWVIFGVSFLMPGEAG